MSTHDGAVDPLPERSEPRSADLGRCWLHDVADVSRVGGERGFENSLLPANLNA